MKIGVVTFPGSNCDHDCLHAVRLLGHEAISLWHKDTRSLTNLDGIILPGGFSYGDYLRAGAIARFSPILKNVVEAAKKGVRVLGICNGFQILLEAGLLEGAMLRNAKIKFVCKEVCLRIENTQTLFTHKGKKGQVLRMPVAHGEGNYVADETTLKRLEDQGQIILRYVNAQGETQTDANPNGALHDIAGICNSEKNVLGMMPHPERRIEDLIGGTDGQVILASFMEKSL